jgi:hypothetical protein
MPKVQHVLAAEQRVVTREACQTRRCTQIVPRVGKSTATTLEGHVRVENPWTNQSNFGMLIHEGNESLGIVPEFSHPN